MTKLIDCDHKLMVIYSDEVNVLETNVVRWCVRCGAVVVDIDVDNRTYPGRIMRMKGPNGFKK